MKRKKTKIISLTAVVLISAIAIVAINNQSASGAPNFGNFDPSNLPEGMENFDPSNLPEGMSNTEGFDFSKMRSSRTRKANINTTAEVASALTENIAPHATYYLEASYIEEGKVYKQGEALLKYTNGEFLLAPYDGAVISSSLPTIDGQLTNSHYVEFSALNVLKVSFRVDESKVSAINLGDEATITVNAVSNETITGVVTNISNTASNGRFTVTVEFENDGNIMLGMTAKVSL